MHCYASPATQPPLDELSRLEACDWLLTSNVNGVEATDALRESIKHQARDGRRIDTDGL